MKKNLMVLISVATDGEGNLHLLTKRDMDPLMRELVIRKLENALSRSVSQMPPVGSNS
jgi:hypothetical protein